MKTEYNKFSRKNIHEERNTTIPSEIITENKEKPYGYASNAEGNAVKNTNKGVWTAVRPVNLRMFAGINASVLKVIDGGEKVKSSGLTAFEGGEEWIEISSKGATGFAMKKYFVR